MKITYILWNDKPHTPLAYNSITKLFDFHELIELDHIIALIKYDDVAKSVMSFKKNLYIRPLSYN